jgi:hypothetical protein
MQPCQVTSGRTCGHSLKEIEDYLGPTDLLLLHNRQRFVRNDYSDDAFIEESVLLQT